MLTPNRCLLILSFLTCLTMPAFGGDKDEAKRLFEAGLNLMKVEDFPGATVNFERSVSLFPTQNSLFNLANCYRATRRYGEALDTLERLRREFGKTLKPEIGSAATRQESELRALVVRLTIQVEPAEARVELDGKETGSGPTRGPLIVAPGEHTLEARHAGYKPWRRTATWVSGKEETEAVRLEPEAAVANPGLVVKPASVPTGQGPNLVEDSSSPAPTIQSDPIYTRWWFWTAATVVAAGAGVGIYAATRPSEIRPTLGTEKLF